MVEPKPSIGMSTSDFVSSIHKIVDSRLRAMIPYVGKIASIGSGGNSVLRAGDDVSGLEIPSLTPGQYAVNDRVLVLPTPSGFDVILGKVSVTPELRYHYQLGPFARENIAGTGSFQTRLYHPSGASTFGSAITTIPIPASGMCVGGIIMSSEARTAGDATLAIEINSVDQLFSTIKLGSSPNQRDSDLLPYSQGFAVAKGDLVQAKIVATNWAPTTADFTAWLFMIGDVS